MTNCIPVIGRVVTTHLSFQTGSEHKQSRMNVEEISDLPRYLVDLTQYRQLCTVNRVVFLTYLNGNSLNALANQRLLGPYSRTSNEAPHPVR
jgi:hypothetical protein